MSDPKEVLVSIARAKAELDEAETELQEAKKALKDTSEYQEVEDAKGRRETARIIFNSWVAQTSAYLQPTLISQVLEKAAEEINAGALDAIGVKCTATVQAHAGA
jgi:hypothetical protein